MSEEEDPFAKIEAIQKRHNKLLEENNRQMRAFGDKIGIAIGFGGNVRGSSAMGATSQTIIKLLEEQNKLLNRN